MAKAGWRVLAAAMTTVALCGCGALDEAKPDQRQQDAAAAHDSCVAKGFSEGSPEFSNCTEAELALMADRRRRGVPETQQPAAATNGRPDTGRLCLPTAAGQSFGC